jgi:Uma2 family endonuclease
MLNLIENAGDRVIFQPENLEDGDQAFERVLSLYPDMRVEMDEAGNILLALPGTIESSFGSGEVFGQLRSWAKRDGSGRAHDGTAIYNLPTGAKMSPDASWVPNAVLAKFGKPALRKVTGAVIAPAFVIEVRSPSDRLKRQLNKCERWIKAGVLEVWLVDPIKRNVHVFRAGRRAVKLLTDPKEVKSEVLDGFVLDCGPVWED